MNDKVMADFKIILFAEKLLQLSNCSQDIYSYKIKINI